MKESETAEPEDHENNCKNEEHRIFLLGASLRRAVRDWFS
jgi:hypothetical protein